MGGRALRRQARAERASLSIIADVLVKPAADAFVEADGVWSFGERKLYVDWIEERSLS
jgi:hypothetical protein